MPADSFDALTKALASRFSRRTAVHGSAIGLAAGVLLARAPTALAQDASPASTPAGGCATGSAEDNLAVARRYFDDALNKRNIGVFDEIAAPDVEIDAGTFPSGDGIETIKSIYTALTTAFPDVQFAIEQSLTDGEYVVLQWIATGTQESDYIGVPPADGKRTWSGISLFRLQCCTIVEMWVEVDGLTQVGLTPQETGGVGATPAATPGFVIGACETATREENTAVAQKWFDVWNTKDVSVYEDIVHPDVIHHFGVLRDAVGIEAMKNGAEQFFTAFPDLFATLDTIVVDGDFVAFRFTETGTQTGEFLGVAPTGKPVTWTGMVILRIGCGRVRESWSEVANIDIWRQLGKLDPEATPAS